MKHAPSLWTPSPHNRVPNRILAEAGGPKKDDGFLYTGIYQDNVAGDNKKAFGVLRYWAIGETGEGESPISYISLPIHRELLCALLCLFLCRSETWIRARCFKKAYAIFRCRKSPFE